jgi:hypothetical protein
MLSPRSQPSLIHEFFILLTFYIVPDGIAVLLMVCILTLPWDDRPALYHNWESSKTSKNQLSILVSPLSKHKINVLSRCAIRPLTSRRTDSNPANVFSDKSFT